MRLVVDASMALAWFLPETESRKIAAAALLMRARELNGIFAVPDIFHYEMAAKIRLWQA